MKKLSESIMKGFLTEKAKADAKAKVETIEANCSHFKVGKAGEKLDDRLNQPDYNDTYSNIEEIFSTPYKEKASAMEAYLIDEFISHHKCDNKKDGDESINDTMADSDTYYVYVVSR